MTRIIHCGLILVLFGSNCFAQVPAASGTCDVEVVTIRQFEPSWFRVTIEAPRTGAIVVVGDPSLVIQAQEGGEWKDLGSLGGARALSSKWTGSVVSTKSAAIEQAARVVWRLQVANWKVIGWAGRYRCRVVWSEKGGIGGNLVGRTGWREFDVAAAGESGAQLRASQAQEDDLWKAYKEVMETPVLNSQHMGLVWSPDGNALGRAMMQTAANAGVVQPCERLAQCRTLPSGVMERIEVLRAIWEWEQARVLAAGQERRVVLMRCLGRLDGILAGGVEGREVALLLKIDVLLGLGRSQEAGVARQLGQSFGSVREVARTVMSNSERLLER